MKKRITAVLSACFILLLISCHKNISLPKTKVNPVVPVHYTSNDSFTIVVDTISSSVTISGRWSLINDSAFVLANPPFYNPVDSNYVGTAADYYDFKADGSLYIHEGSYTDSIQYEMLAGYKLNFIYNSTIHTFDSLGNAITTNYKKNFTITTLTENNFNLTSSLVADILTPEGYFANAVKLKR